MTGEPMVLEAVVCRENMQRAWQRVRSNRGAAGVDGLTIDQTLWRGKSGVQMRILVAAIAVILATLLLICFIQTVAMDACIPHEQLLHFGVGFVGLALAATGILYLWVFVPENTSRNQLLAGLEEAALTDELTGLSNRRGLHAYLNHLLQRGMCGHDLHVMLVVDLNGFNAVNDHWGHDTGDALLIRVADCLIQTTRSSDLCARVGGDEFVVILHLDTPVVSEAHEIVQHIVERLASEIRGPIHLQGARVQVGVSIGIRLFGSCDFDFDEMFHQADQAMYRAKADPDRDYVIHDESARPTTPVPISAR